MVVENPRTKWNVSQLDPSTNALLMWHFSKMNYYALNIDMMSPAERKRLVNEEGGT